MKKTTIFAIIILILASVTSCSCSRNQNRFRVDLSGSDLVISIDRFDKAVFALDTNDIAAGIPALREEFGSFFYLYTQHIMRLGHPDSSYFIPSLRSFLTNPYFREVYEESLKMFQDVSEIERRLTIAFRHIEHFFPEIPIPRVLMHVSGFNQSVIVTENELSISIDNYLGVDFIHYQHLLHNYQLESTRPERVPSDLMLGWLLGVFPLYPNSDVLLDIMLHRGKIMFLLETIMPYESEETLMAYTTEQLRWLNNNERAMWTNMAEMQHLFTTDRTIVVRYINDAPTTSFFPRESPGRAAIWIGWQIIRSYMRNNPEVGLRELMENTDYRGILERSRYRP